MATLAEAMIGSWHVDDDSIDLLLGRTGGSGTVHSPRLEVQLKCSSRKLMRKDGVHYPLKLKNYDDLRDPQRHLPAVLVVLLVPASVDDWVRHSHAQMALKHCGYWLNLSGLPSVGNAQNITVRMPRKNKFDPAALAGIMDRIGQQKTP